MARQKGIIKLKGTIGDLSFYKSKDGYLAREKGGVDAERIKNDPAFQRTRENGSEFGRAGKAGKLLRTAFRPLVLKIKDRLLTSRLTKQMLQVVKSDTENLRGERTVTAGDLGLIEGLDFNASGRLEATMYAPYEVAVDRVAGDATITVPGFVPSESMATPQGATHMKLLGAVSEMDFETDEFTFNSAFSEPLAIGTEAVEEQELSLSFNENATGEVVVAFGIEFYQEVNGEMYAIKNGAFNCLSLVKVDRPAPVEMT